MIITDAHVPELYCTCGHGEDNHYKHIECSQCKHDFCHVTGCFCLTFKRVFRRPTNRRLVSRVKRFRR